MPTQGLLRGRRECPIYTNVGVDSLRIGHWHDPRMSERRRTEPTRITVRCPDEAASVLGVGRDFFNKHVRPDIRTIRRGKFVLVRIEELDRWAREREQRTLDGDQ
jgi:hypothetical protein